MYSNEFAFSVAIHNGNLYQNAVNLLNDNIGEDGFHLWVELPNGEQMLIPKGSKLKFANITPAIKSKGEED